MGKDASLVAARQQCHDYNDDDSNEVLALIRH